MGRQVKYVRHRWRKNGPLNQTVDPKKEVSLRSTIGLESVFAISDDVAAREIGGELIVIPLVEGIGDLEDELYSFNEEGRAIWKLLDGKKTLKKIARELAETYDAPLGKIEKDVLGIIEELFKRKILIVRG